VPAGFEAPAGQVVLSPLLVCMHLVACLGLPARVTRPTPARHLPACPRCSVHGGGPHPASAVTALTACPCSASDLSVQSSLNQETEPSVYRISFLSRERPSVLSEANVSTGDLDRRVVAGTERARRVPSGLVYTHPGLPPARSHPRGLCLCRSTHGIKAAAHLSFSRTRTDTTAMAGGGGAASSVHIARVDRRGYRHCLCVGLAGPSVASAKAILLPHALPFVYPQISRVISATAIVGRIAPPH